MNAKYPALHPQVAIQIVDGSAVIVLADSGEVLVFNETGTRILSMIDGERSVMDVAGAIESEYKVSAEEAHQDVESFLRTLAEVNALIFEPDSSAPDSAP
jgi:coenzyme PQQ synthesis protein D (PqqD)